MTAQVDIATSGATEAPDGAPPVSDEVEQVIALVNKQPLHREILYRTLEFCAERRALVDLENEIASYPEFKHATQDQFHLISFLTDAGGLERVELDAAGAVVGAAAKDGLTEDEIDDLVASYAYVRTEAGAAARERLDPRRRMQELLDCEPEHTAAFAKVLALCATPRTYAEIEEQLAGVDDSSAPAVEVVGQDAPGAVDEPETHPSYYVSTLEKAGAIIWADAWTLSKEGRALLESIGEQA